MIASNVDFVGEVNIPNNTNADVITYINLFIAKYEPQFLEMVFGYSLYKAYLTDPEETRFTNLINGVEYNDSDLVLQKYVGLKPALVRYIYYFMMKDRAINHTGIGTWLPNKEVMSVHPNKKMVATWNDMVYNVRTLTYVFDDMSDVYPEYDSSINYYLLKTINEFGI